MDNSPNYLTNVNNAINTNCVYAFWKIHCGQCSAAMLKPKRAVDSHHESDGILSQKCFSLDKISDLLLLSWNWGHVNLNTAAASFGKQTFSGWLWVAKTAFGRINLEEGKPSTDTKHSLQILLSCYEAHCIQWAISWLSPLFPSIYVKELWSIFYKKSINSVHFETHINIK